MNLEPIQLTNLYVKFEASAVGRHRGNLETLLWLEGFLKSKGKNYARCATKMSTIGPKLKEKNSVNLLGDLYMQQGPTMIRCTIKD